MTHDDGRLVAFLAGDLSDDGRQRFEAHLLDCDECWTAVREDRRGRVLAETLREVAPAAVRERVRVAIDLTPAPTHRPRRRWAAIGVAVGASIAVGIAIILTSLPVRRHDPVAVAAVMRLARASRAGPSTSAPTLLTAGDQRIRIERYESGGRDIVVAESSTPFPMPSAARPVGKGPDAPWVATRGDVRLLCFSHPRHLLIVSRLSAADLLDAARELGLAGPIQPDVAPG